MLCEFFEPMLLSIFRLMARHDQKKKPIHYSVFVVWWSQSVVICFTKNQTTLYVHTKNLKLHTCCLYQISGEATRVSTTGILMFLLFFHNTFSQRLFLSPEIISSLRFQIPHHVGTQLLYNEFIVIIKNKKSQPLRNHFMRRMRVPGIFV